MLTALRRLGPGVLVLPLLSLVVVAFLLPLCWTLSTALRDPELGAALPRTAAMLRLWDGRALPGDEAFRVLGEELGAAEARQSLGALTRRLNLERPGSRALLLGAARAGMVSRDGRWGELATWRLLRQAAGPWTDFYVLRALDLVRGDDGRVVGVPADQAVFRAVFARTFGIAALATALTLVLAYPLAAALAAMRGWPARVALGLVVAPLWVSILVRTASWFLLLQRQGPVNALLLALGLVDAPVQLLFTRVAVVVTMVQVLLPFAVLPLFAAMRDIEPLLLQAARGLGARPWQMVARVHWPLARPGMAAGGAIVFLLAVGFWVTPALVGGPGDQMVGSFVAAYVNETLNWGMASALAGLLLLGTVACLAVAGGALRVLVPR